MADFSQGEPLKRVSYSPDGQIAATLLYPRPNGQWVDWYENGQKISEGYYLDGERHGKWKCWYADGRLCSIKVYNHGKLVKTEYEQF